MNNGYEAVNLNHGQSLSIGDMISRLLNSIKKHWYFIPIFACIGCCFMVAYTYRGYVPMYSATATFTVSPKGDKISASPLESAVSSAQMEKTFPYIITSAPMTRVVAKDLNLGYMPGTIAVSSLPETNLFTITATANDYQMAYKLLRSVINNYPEVAEYVVGDTEMVLVIPPSASSEPSNKVDYRIRALIGTGIGLVVALALILVLELFNVTVRKPDDVEMLLDCERIGSTVKVVNKKSSNASEVISLEGKHIDSRYKEAIYSIRNTLLKKCNAKNIKSIMVTSTGAGEGKTTFSSNLAIALRKKHFKTILIDCDLRNPSVRKQLNIPLEEDSLGIVDVVTGNCNLEDALIRLKRSGLYVLPGTIPVENASELMVSKQMTDLIEALKELFDYVIIDVPPVGVVADALEIRDGVGGVVFVVRQDYVKVNKIREAISSFGGSRIAIMGCVFNMASGVFGSRGYGRYGYGNYGYGSYGYGYGLFSKYYSGKKYGYGKYGYGKYGYGSGYGYGYGSGYGYGYGYGYGGYGYGYGNNYGDFLEDEEDYKENELKEGEIEEVLDEDEFGATVFDNRMPHSEKDSKSRKHHLKAKSKKTKKDSNDTSTTDEGNSEEKE